MNNPLSLSLYFPAPDDVTIEIYWDINDQPFGRRCCKVTRANFRGKFLNPFEQTEQ